MIKVTSAKNPGVTKKGEQAAKVMKRMREQSEEQKAAALANTLGLLYIDLNMFPVSNEDLRLLAEEDSRKYRMGLFKKVGKKTYIGIVDPENRETLERITVLEKENGWEVTKYVISQSSLQKIWKRYREAPFLENLEAMYIMLRDKDLDDFEQKFGNLIDLKKRIREIPTTEIISTIMAGAVKMGASDVHIEPQEKDMRLRFRIDGVLQDIALFPLEICRFIISRIKMMGGMKINLRDIAQDGHFSVDMERNRINVRVNAIPGNHGESIVMRLLNQADILLSVEDLGLRGLAYERLQKQIEKPHGMILTTGPTGSGKTTTLYALVNKMNTPGIKIITIEDPIEYEIAGVSQTQVEKDRSYTFAEGLRAIVRQDPDVVLVGEIRDEETADISVNAALTGHLVLSTLHTNNAAATVPRMIELGVKPNIIVPSVNAFIAQRLVRKLCPDCKEQYVPARETVDSIKKVLSIISPKSKVDIPKDIEYMYRPVGCPKCHGLGYRGRIGIFEILTMTEPIEKLVRDMEGEREIMQAAIEDGMVTMAQDGILKAVEGLTSMEEVWRATGQTEFLEEVYEKLMEQSLSRAIPITKTVLENVSTKLGSIEELKYLVDKSNQKDTLHYIIAASVLLGAGDIHIEPEGEYVGVRFRIDGIMQNIAKIPLNEYPSLLGSIKLLSGFKTEVREGVKDGRFTIALEESFGSIVDTKIDVRVSIILGGHGETVVMRLLNKSAAAIDVESLGIRKQNLERILHEAKKPNGIFLNTGPTGSGKTTTLYSILKLLNKSEVKIITVEDPIEYQMEGLLQTQVNEEQGYSFSTALRALLRQNPDIMMIGEIRDEETANIAVQAALTGHSILSTLHTNDSVGSVQRLLNMGLRADDLSTASNAFMAQRLVRKLCDCKQPIAMTEEQKSRVQKIIATISPKAGVEIFQMETIYQAKGCEKCNGIGYKGRTTVSEVFVLDREIKDLIAQGALTSQLRDKAIENGMITMAQDGILKVLEGITTFEEVDRVVEE